jgi:hypothetical protein
MASSIVKGLEGAVMSRPSLGVKLGLLPPEGRDLILAGAILSITLNPLVFATVDGGRLDPGQAGIEKAVGAIGGTTCHAALRPVVVHPTSVNAGANAVEKA